MVKVAKKLITKKFEDIQVLDDGVVKNMQQIKKIDAGEMVFECEDAYYKRHLAGNPNYRLVPKEAVKPKPEKDDAKPEPKKGDANVGKETVKAG